MSRKKETGPSGAARKRLKKATSRNEKPREPKRFRFQTFKQQLAEISVETIRRIGGWKGITPPAENSSWFEEALEEWRELNCTAHFARFCAQVRPYVGGGLPQLVFHQAEIKAVLLENLSIEGSLAVTPLSALIAMLARDLSTDFGLQTYKEAILCFIKILNATEAIEDIEAIVRTLFYLTRVLEKQLVGDLTLTFTTILRPALLLGLKPKHHVQQILLELWSMLGRKILIPSGLTNVICDGMVSTEVASQMLALVCFDGKEPSKFLPKHFKAVLSALISSSSPILESFIGRVFYIDSSETVCKTVIEGLSALTNPESLVLIVEHILETSCKEPILLSLLPVPAPTQELADRSVKAACGLLMKRGVDLAATLKARPYIMPVFTQSSKASLLGIWILLAASRDNFLHPLFSASAIEKVIEEVFAIDPIAAMVMLELCRSRGGQLPTRASIDYATIISSSSDPAAVLLAVRLADQHIISADEILNIAKRLMIDISRPSPLMISLLEAWTSHGTAEGSVELVNLISGWTGYASVLDLLRKSNSRGDATLTAAKRGLLSGDSKIRASALFLLESLGQSESVMTNCKKLEIESAWSFNCDREKGIHLSALFHQLQSTSSFEAQDAEVVMRQLVGIVLGGFRPIQPETGRVLSAYVQKFGGLFRQIVDDALALLNDHAIVGRGLNQSAVLPASPFDHVAILEGYLLAPFSECRMYGPHALTSLFDFLSKHPASMDFVQNDLIALLVSVFTGNEGDRYTEGFISKLEMSLGSALTAFSNLKNLGKNPRVEEFGALLFSKFMPLGDASIQMKALEAYFAVNPSIVPQWRDHFRGLLDSEQSMREKLVELSSAPRLEDPEIVAVMVRLLYGRMVGRKGSSSGRTSPKVRRKLVLNYIASWDRPSVGLFIGYLCSTVEQVDIQSKSKIVGFLNLLEPVLGKLGRFTPVPEFTRLFDLILRFASIDDEKTVRRLAMQRIHQAWFILLQEGSSFDAELEAVLMSRHATLWTDIIMPRISRLEDEYGQSRSALLDLLELWAATRKPDLVVPAIEPLASALGSNSRVKATIAGQITSIFESLLKAGVDLTSVLPSLLRSISGRLESLLKVEESRLVQRLLGLLLGLADLLRPESDAEAVETLVEVLFTSDLLSSKKYDKMESMQATVLSVLCRLVPISTRLDPEASYHKVAIWFGSAVLKSRRSREPLASLFACIAFKLGNDDLVQLASCLMEMNTFEKDQLDEEPDWDRRTAGFNRLRQMAGSVASDNIKWWLPVLSWSMWELGRDQGELAGRNQALFLLETFLALDLEEGSVAWQRLLIDRIYAGIRQGIKSGREELTRSGLMSVLGKLVARHPSSKLFSALQPLLAGGDEEADVFQNLGHIQVHRRTRAIRRLSEFAAVETSLIDRKMIEEVFLPFMRPLAVPASNEQASPDALLQTEAIQAVAVLTSRLPLKSILTKISLTIKKLKHVAQEQQSSDPAMAGKSKKAGHQARALLRLVPAMVKQSVITLIADSESTNSLLSLLFETALGPATTNQAPYLTIPLAESIGLVLSSSPDESLRLRHLPRLMSTLCVGLRDKEFNGREAARKSLSKLLGSLGPEYLGYALTEMESTLMPVSHQKLLQTRGSKLIGSNSLFTHVHGYTTACLLESLDGPGLAFSDTSYKALTQTAIDHGFGQLAKEKVKGGTGASGQEWTGRAIEARHQKSYQIISILARYGTMSQLVSLFKALSARLSSSSDEEGSEDDLEEVDAVFKALEASLLERILSIPDDLKQHMVLLHSIASGTTFSIDSKLYAHRPALSAVQILSGLLKESSNKLEVSPLLDGFIPLLVGKFLIDQGKHQSLLTASIKCLTTLLNGQPIEVLPSLAKNSQLLNSLMGRLFELLVKTDAARFPDLTASCLRLISTAVRRISDVTLTDSQTKALLAFTVEHLEQSSNGQSTLAFSLVKALLSRRVMLVELLDLMKTVSKIMIVSPDASVRSQCRSVYLQYLSEYPLGPDRLQEHLAGLAKNLAGFEWDTGRQSAMLLVGSLVGKLPSNVLGEWSSVLLVTVASRVSVETSQVCRDALSDLIQSLLTRISNDPTLSSALQEASTLLKKWTGEGVKPTVALAAWIMAKPVLNALCDGKSIDKSKDKFGLAQHFLETGKSILSAQDLNGALLVPVLEAMLVLGDQSIIPILVSSESLMMYESLTVRDLVNRLLMPHLPSLESDSVQLVAPRLIQQILGLPAETDPSVSDCLVKGFLSLSIQDDSQMDSFVGMMEKPLRSVLADPVQITKHRATILAALRLFAGLIAKDSSLHPTESSDSDKQLPSYLRPLLSIAIRTATNDHLSAIQSSIVDRPLAECLRSAANELLEMAQATLGAEAYTALTQQVVQSSARTKSARKTALSHLAVNDPEAYARRKIGRNQAKKEQRKRKVDRTREKASKRTRLHD